MIFTSCYAFSYNIHKNIIFLGDFQIRIIIQQYKSFGNILNGTPVSIKNLVTNLLEGYANYVTGTVNLSITLDPTPHQKTLTVKMGKKHVVLPLYTGNDDISGRIDLQLLNSTRYEHLGLKVYLVGLLQIYSNSNLTTEFISTSKELEPAGYLSMNKSYNFKFSNFDKQYQSFNGEAGRVRYFIKILLHRNNIINPISQQQQFAVTISNKNIQYPIVPTILEVGVDNRLHIEFKLTKNSYHIKEWVEGTVTFFIMKLPINKMELSIVRKQTLGTADSISSESKVLEVYQVMDGCPEESSVIPFRMSLKGIKNLTPSYKNIHNRLFVRHWLNLVIFDEDGRRYYKQAEVTFYRK